jgi:plastocyanin
MSTGFPKRRRGILAVTSTLAVAAGIAVASVAGAAQETKIYVSDQDGYCFTKTQGKAKCDAGERVDLTIQTGDTVVWDFTGSTAVHNAYPGTPLPPSAPPSTPANIAWDGRKPNLVPTGTDTWTFGAPGVYRFYCQAHASMVGTITVEGSEVETPEPTPDETEDPVEDPTEDPVVTPAPTFAATPGATATPDDHTSTPKPGGGAKDTAAPRLQRASAKPVKGGARVRFWLSEPAKVSIAVARKGSKRSVTSTVVQSPAGTRSFVLRTRALKRGTYTATLTPVDAMGNKGAVVTTRLRVK